MYVFSASLFQAKMAPGSVGSALETLTSMLPPTRRDQVSSFLIAHSEKSYSMQDFKKYLCKVPFPAEDGIADPCGIAEKLHIGTLVLWVSFGLAAKLMVSGLFLEWRYNCNPEAGKGNCARTFYSLAPIALMIGLITYAVLTASLKELFPKTDQMVLSSNFWLGAGIASLSFLPAAVFTAMGPDCAKEEENEPFDNTAKDGMQTGSNYGAIA